MGDSFRHVKKGNNMLCLCGCGQETKLASRSQKSKGWVKGEPLKYIYGHNNKGKIRMRKEKPLPPPADVPDTPAEIEKYVLGLGRWKCKNSWGLVHNRPASEYRELLKLCIATYGARKDKTGELHVLYARRELSLLK